MEQVGFGEYGKAVVDKGIDGNRLFDLEVDDLSLLGMEFTSQRKKFLRLIGKGL